MTKKVAIYTLGCKLNQVDSEAIREAFERSGYTTVPFREEADVYVVNTCSVTGKTDHQARQMVRRALKHKERCPGVRVVVAGCYPQTHPEDVRRELPGLDLVVGSARKEEIPNMLEQLVSNESGPVPMPAVPDIFDEREFRPAPVDSFANYTKAFLRIHEGCNKRCSYCIVPYARGRSRSAPTGEVIAQAERFAANGYREVVVVGIHIGRYGLDLEPRTTLAALLRRLYEVEGLSRIRLSSIDPKEFSEELFETLDAVRDKLCDHFHISLQSGDDGILRAMKRDYTADEFATTVLRLRDMFPDVNVGADVIVGFPGETEAAFDETYKLADRLSLGYMHVFRYSKRPGTTAAEMPGQVQEEIKKNRSLRMRALRGELAARFRARFIGRELEVLFEKRRDGKNGLLTGLTRNYLRIYAEGDDELMGKLVVCRITEPVSGGLGGEVVIMPHLPGDSPGRCAGPYRAVSG